MKQRSSKKVHATLNSSTQIFAFKLVPESMLTDLKVKLLFRALVLEPGEWVPSGPQVRVYQRWDKEVNWAASYDHEAMEKAQRSKSRRWYKDSENDADGGCRNSCNFVLRWAWRWHTHIFKQECPYS